MTKSCGGAIASTSPPGWTGSSSRAIPAISVSASASAGSAARCSPSAGASVGPIVSGRSALPSSCARASSTASTSASSSWR